MVIIFKQCTVKCRIYQYLYIKNAALSYSNGRTYRTVDRVLYGTHDTQLCGRWWGWGQQATMA